MSKSLVFVNLTPGDGQSNLVDSGELQTQMEAISEGGKTAITAISYASGGAVQSSGSQFQWLVDDNDLTTAKAHIADFIDAHTFAETPTYLVLSASASS